MTRDHAAELIPAFVVDALDEGDRLLVEGLLAIEPAARERRDRFEALLSLAAVPAPIDPAGHEAAWAALRERLPARPPAPNGLEELELPNVLAGRYVLHEELGRGAMGVLYKATDQEAGTTVAVRLNVASSSPRLRERLRREAQALESLDHPNLLLPLGFGTLNELSYTVLPFLDPVRCLHDDAYGERRWAPAAATRVIRQAGLGLAAAHRRGVIHRDLNPRNLLLEQDGTVRVADLERSRVNDDEYALTRCGAVIGTPFYLAPEVVQGKGDVDERVDVYALGQILYELLTGELLFRERTAAQVVRAKLEGRLPDPGEVAPELPPGYREVLGKALATDPARRYPCVEAFLAELAAVERGEAVEPAAAPPWGVGGGVGACLAAVPWWGWLALGLLTLAVVLAALGRA